MHRRRVLSTAGCLGAVGLAGCLGVLNSGSGESEDDESDSDSEDGTATGTTAPGDDGTESSGEDNSPEGTVLSYGFEDADLPAWTVADSRWDRTTEHSYEGTASGSVDAYQTVSVLATVSPEPLADGARISRLSYYWRETSESYGGGVTLTNSDGGLELFVGSDNPEWIVLTDTEAPTYSEITGADGFDRWIRTELDFDWADSRVTVTFTDTETGSTATDSFDLAAGTDVATIALQAFTSAEVDSGNGLQSDSCEMYWDEISVTV